MTSISQFVQEVGYEVMDAQHRAIMSCIVELGRCAGTDDVRGTDLALAALWEEAVGHFALEEDLMVRQAYPERDAHRAAHHLFLQEMLELMRLLEHEGVSDVVAARACRWIPEWFIFHVQANDAPLARFLVRKAASRIVTNALGGTGPESQSDA
jgi:hemerythrin-like metal-binding protein